MARHGLVMYALVAGAGLVTGAAPVDAQVLGVFRWQTQPYCNVVHVAVIVQGPAYQLAGTDDLCGTGSAPLSGTAVVVGTSAILGFSVALPSGLAAHLTAVVDVGSLTGTWNDADGRSGSFVFNGAAGGSPRPAPASAAMITSAQLAPSIFGGTGAAATVARSDHDHDARYYTKAQSDAKRPRAAYVGDAIAYFNVVGPFVVRTASILVPGPGVIVASAAVTVITGSTVTEVGCSISQTDVIDTSFVHFTGSGTGTVAGVRHITAAAGSHTVNFVCARSAGTGSIFLLARPQLSLLFIPD